MKLESISDVTGGWLRLLVVLLHFAGDVGGKDGLQPLSGAAADNPGVCGGHGAPKAGGELSSSKGKAFVPGHAWRVTRQRKNAMRKNKACDPIRNAYSLRMSNTTKSPMAKAFATVRGAIKRGNITELRCKRIWLESVIRQLPGTVFANEAKIGLRIVNKTLND